MILLLEKEPTLGDPVYLDGEVVAIIHTILKVGRKWKVWTW